MDGYSVAVETRAPNDAPPLALTDDLIDESADEAAAHHGVFSIGDRSWGVRISVDATDARAAHDQGRAVVEKLSAKVGLPAWPVIQVEVTREDVLAEEVARPNYPDLVSGPEAAEILGVTRQRLWSLAANHSAFPEPLYRLRVGPLWLRASIEAFDERWERRPGRPRKTS